MSKSVSRVLSRIIIYLDLLLPIDSCDLPFGMAASNRLSISPFGLAPDGVYIAN